MRSYPSVPDIEAAPDGLFDTGHLWLLEAVDGAPLRFRLLESGVIQFGDADRVYDDPDELPAQYQHAVRHIRTRLDRQALRTAVEDPEEIVFFGEAMQYQGTNYDWERTPSVLGVDIWSAATERFRPPDAVEAIFDRLGLDPINAVEKEVHPRDFDPETYDVPESAWYDGPARGVVIRDKQGRRAKLPGPEGDAEPPMAAGTTATEIADRYGSRQRFERARTELARQGGPVTVEALVEYTLSAVYRELDPGRFGNGVDQQAIRSEIARRASRFVNEH